LQGLYELEQGLDDRAARLERAARVRLSILGQKVEALAGRLATLSPLNVLARGYSLTRTEADRRVLRDASAVRPGDRLVTRLCQGEVVSRVEEVRPAAGS
jgi:exodeoxyribonuclease VII large subunit